MEEKNFEEKKRSRDPVRISTETRIRNRTGSRQIFVSLPTLRPPRLRGVLVLEVFTTEKLLKFPSCKYISKIVVLFLDNLFRYTSFWYSTHSFHPFFLHESFCLAGEGVRGGRGHNLGPKQKPRRDQTWTGWREGWGQGNSIEPTIRFYDYPSTSKMYRRFYDYPSTGKM